MLDNEPNDPTSTPTDAGTGDTPPTKVVRRRRATKATAAPTPEAASEPAALTEQAATGGPASEQAVSDQDATGQDVAAQDVAAGDEAVSPTKRVRKAPAKKAAPRKRTAKTATAIDPDPTGRPEETDSDPVAGEVVPEAAPALDPPVEPAPVTVTVTVTEAATETAAPAPRTRRRAPAVAVTFQAPDAVPAPADAEPTDDASESAPPRRRRRAGTAGAVTPGALLPTLLEPELVPGAEAEQDAPRPTRSRRTPGRLAEPTEETDQSDDDAAGGPDEARAADDDESGDRPRRRRRGRRGRGPRTDEDGESNEDTTAEDGAATGSGPEDGPDGDDDEDGAPGTRRRRRRRRSGGGGADGDEDGVPTVTHVREPREPREPREAKEPRERQQRVRGASAADEDGVRGITGSTRMAAKRARRQEGRDSGRRRPAVLSEAEFLARREAVERTMIVRQQGDRTQIAVLEDDVLVEHYVTKASAQAYAGNVYLGRVQNVLPSMEAAFVDVGKGKNGVLYAGEVNYELAGSGPRKIESALKSGQEVLVQVSKDPIGHKGARLTAAVSLPGRYLVYVPQGSLTGISRKLPEGERARLKSILKKVVPDDAGVIIRTAAEGASEEEINADVVRLQEQWADISAKATKGGAPKLLHAEPDLVVRVVRDVFNEDFTRLIVQGDTEWETIKEYVDAVAPDLAPRLSRHTAETDVFTEHRIDEQLAKALDRKVWLPSGGSLVIDRTEAMIVVDVNTGKYVGKGGNLEETVTRNNLEAAEEIARQLRLRDLGGIIVIDFIDMVLESNRDLVVRRLVECLGRDRTKHQVAEVTSLGLVQMTRKRVGQGLLESFSETCEHCNGRGVIVSSAPVDRKPEGEFDDREDDRGAKGRRRGRSATGGSAAGGNGAGSGNGAGGGTSVTAPAPVDPAAAAAAAAAVAAIAKASGHGTTGIADASGREDPLGTGGVEAAPDAPVVAETPSDAETALDVQAPAPQDDDSPARSRGRRRRGGRGAGAPAVESDGESALTTTPDPATRTAAVDPAPVAPVAEEPAADATAAERPVTQAPPAAASRAATNDAVTPVSPVEPVGTGAELEEPVAEVIVDEGPPTPRRRRRATSRPAGPAD